MHLDGLPEKLLKLFSVEGGSGTHSRLTKYIKTGVLLGATVIKYFPEKNKAIIEIADKNMMVETQKPLKAGRFLLSVMT